MVRSHIDGESTGQHIIGIFDTIAPLEKVTLSFEIKGNLKLEPANSSDAAALLTDEYAADDDLRSTVSIYLYPGNEYTYVEILRVIDNWHRNRLSFMALDWLPRDASLVWNEDARVVVAVHQNGTLLWPAFRKMVETGGRFSLWTNRGASTEVLLTQGELDRAALKTIDFWML